MFFDILRVGASPASRRCKSVLTISIFTTCWRNSARDPRGYGIGARLEFLLTSIAFSFGIASVPMIGMAVGAGRIARARRIAGSQVRPRSSPSVRRRASSRCSGSLGQHFTDSATVRATSHKYLSTVAPFYAFIGLASTMYFSSQGAAK